MTTGRLTRTISMLACLASPLHAQDEFGRLTPEAISTSRLTRLHDAIESYRARHGRMPDDAGSLLDDSFVRDRLHLRDQRQPVLIGDPFGRAPHQDRTALFRIVDTWREGPIATSDLPRRGTWMILTGTGEVYEQPVDPAWLGRYTPHTLSDAELDERLDLRAAHLGVYVSDGRTDSGRPGVGVDGIIPGYYRNGFLMDFSIQNGETDLRPGDLIVTFDGVRVESLEDLENLMPDGPLDWDTRPFLEVIRDGRIESVRPLLAHDYAGISAREPRERRDIARFMLERDHPDDAYEVDCILLGLLDLDALLDRPGAIDRLDDDLWIRLWEHAEGSEAALEELKGLLDDPDLSTSRTEDLRILQSQQWRRLGQFDAALSSIETLERGRQLALIRDMTRLRLDDDERAAMLGDVRDIWVEKFGILIDTGRIDDAITYAGALRNSGADPDDLAEAIGTCMNILLFEGYPRASLTLAKESASLFEDEDQFDDALEFFEGYVRRLESELE